MRGGTGRRREGKEEESTARTDMPDVTASRNTLRYVVPYLLNLIDKQSLDGAE